MQTYKHKTRLNEKILRTSHKLLLPVESVDEPVRRTHTFLQPKTFLSVLFPKYWPFNFF